MRCGLPSKTAQSPKTATRFENFRADKRSSPRAAASEFSLEAAALFISKSLARLNLPGSFGQTESTLGRVAGSDSLARNCCYAISGRENGVVD